jgi:hypothetical protein
VLKVSGYRCIVALLVLGVATQVLAVDPVAILPGVKLATPPTIDGVVDLKTEWAQASKGSGLYDENTGQKAQVETEFWFAYDEKYIYFAAKMQDPEPKNIRATAYQTNVSLRGDDTMSISVDPFGKLSDYNTFIMNPKGATNLSISGGRAAKREWIGEFVAKGRITKEGWEVEARIPWAIMPLPAAGPRTLRLDVVRYHARTERWLEWGYSPTQSSEFMPKWTDVVIPHVDSPRVLKLLPFGYMGAIEGGAGIFDGGLDFKTSLSDQIEGVGSIKPDFRNIEQQILSLDFSHYERIADESRPFFNEGSYHLDPTYDEIQFISQRIPDFDVGLKAYGKLNDRTSFGIMDTNTLGQTNSFVAAVSHKLNNTSSISVVGTSLDASGQRNHTGGLYCSKRLGSYYLRGRFIGSDDETRGQGYDTSAELSYMQGSWYAYGYYNEVDPAFHPSLGYSPQVDLKGGQVYASYSGQLRNGSIQAITASASGANFQNFDGTHAKSSFFVSSSATWNNGPTAEFDANFTRFQGIDEHLYSAFLVKPQYDLYRNWKAGVTWGSLQGEDYFTPTCSTAFRPLRNLQLGLRYQFMDFYGSSDQAILTANYDMGNDNGISTRVVKQDKDWNAYVSFRRSGNRGTEYYLIIGDPNALTFKASVIFKVTVPIEIRL